MLYYYIIIIVWNVKAVPHLNGFTLTGLSVKEMFMYKFL